MGPGRILVVDEERALREGYQDALESRGYVVRTAASGQEALAALAADPADLLLTEVRLPGMDGIELVGEALRLDPGMEAVAVAAAEELATAVRAMQSGCADLLVKPVDDERLGQSAARALTRARLRREHTQLLHENLEYVRSQTLFHQGFAILGTLDLERLVDLVLQLLARATDAQGAALWIADDRGQLLLRAYRGLVDRSALPERIDARDGELGARILAGAPFAPPGTSAGDTFFAPLLADEEPMGVALLSDRARGRFGAEQQEAVATLCRFAAIALRNARRVQQLERVGLRDRETSAYNLSYFVDYAGKEFYKARRYGRSFSLAVLTLDGAEQLRREVGRDAFRAAIRGLVDAVSRAVRDADILAKVAENEYYVLLPETDHFGALMFARRAADEVRAEEAMKPLAERAPALLALGAATFPQDGEDFDELIHVARVRQEEQRGSLARAAGVAGLGPNAFWELCDRLLSGLLPIPAGSPSATRPADPEMFAAVQREAAREIGRDPRARGHLYVGVRGGVSSAAVLSALPPPVGTARSTDASHRIAVLGPRGGAELEPAAHPMLSLVWLDGERRFQDREFVLFLSEHSAYALLQDARGRAFHTADAPLVDALVARLQNLYDLEPL